MDIYIKLGITVGASLVFLYFMLKAQAKKEREAELKFQQTLKSYGMVDYVIPRPIKTKEQGDKNDSKT